MLCSPTAPATRARCDVVLWQGLWEGNQEAYSTFWDLYNLVLYTGYASVMPLVQPLTPLLFLINNLLEVRPLPDFTSSSAASLRIKGRLDALRIRTLMIWT